MNFNKVIIVGNVVQDPENRALPDGRSVTTIRVATNRVWNDASGNKQQATEFHSVVFFGKLADIAHQYLIKGKLVLVEGRLQTRRGEDQSGGKRYRTEIVAESMQMGPRGSEAGGRESGGSSATGRPHTPAKPTAAKQDIPVIEEEDMLSEEDLEDIPF